MKCSKLVALFVTAGILTACTQPNGAPNSGVMNGGGVDKTDIGTAVGAIGGGVIGSTMGGGRGKIATTIAGTLLGGFLGNQVGKSLDNADMAAYNQASQRALETSPAGQALPWQGHNASGTIVPAAPYQNSSGQYCREYRQTINVGGQSKQGYGTACRQPDGSWQIVQ